ncbi:MAG: GlsB/YeaQ/YmgE family stress response membrane protein [Pyrinomonadaceae bacterium]
MSIIWQLLVGLIVGLIARILLPGKEPIANGALGWLITALIGVAGAFLGTMIARMLWADAGYAAGWIMSILGAIILLIIVRYLFGGLKAGASGSVS